MAVKVQHFALEAGKRNDIQLTQVDIALFVVGGFFMQGRTQALQQLARRNPFGPRFAPDQLAQGIGTAPALQFCAPFIVQASAFIEHKEHFKACVAEQHVRRFLARLQEIFTVVGDIQALQQALADPTLTLPFAGIG